jgi:transposase-like protein
MVGSTTAASAPPAARAPAPTEHTFPDGSKLELQVNFCKNPACPNYGIPVAGFKRVRASIAPSGLGAGYTLMSGGSGAGLTCKGCGEFPPLKSNNGIAQELARISEQFDAKPAPSCTTAGCKNALLPVSKGRYKKAGKTSQGSQRYQCLECRKTLSIPSRVTMRQRLPRLNTQVLSLLLSKTPLSRICDALDISPATLYDKLDFIYEQCRAFSVKKERRLPEIAKGRKWYLSVDRQDYIVNWSRRRDRRNVQLRAIGSADLHSQYVLGMHLNFDRGLDREGVEKDARDIGDYSQEGAFRRYARLWLTPDYDKAVIASAAARRKGRRKRGGTTLGDDIGERYDEAAARPDVESAELLSHEQSLPKQGMQVRSEYTMYAHFYWLAYLLRGAEKVRFFMDQESGIRAACLAAFNEEIKARRCDAMYVRLGKEMTVGEKRKAKQEADERFQDVASTFPKGTPDYEIEIAMMKEEMARADKIGKWKDRWMTHPLPNSAEPLKAICYLTDFDDYDEDHRARLFLKATLHPIDRFFMLLRRRVNMLERSVGTASKAGRQWHGYSAYQPGNIEKLLEIFRVYYNFSAKGKDKQTPAMRLGLADRPYSKAEILNMA